MNTTVAGIQHVNTQHAIIPRFVGHDYFCDTGSKSQVQLIFYPDDPLWGGERSEFNTCCSWNTPPWFMKQLSSPTTNDIDMRLCSNGSQDSEDITVEKIELYVQLSNLNYLMTCLLSKYTHFSFVILISLCVMLLDKTIIHIVIE